MPRRGHLLRDDVPAEWAEYTAANADFFDELGSPGGAARLGLIKRDVPLVAQLPADINASE